METTRRATFYAPDGQEFDVHQDNNIFTAVNPYNDKDIVHFDHFPTYNEVMGNFNQGGVDNRFD